MHEENKLYFKEPRLEMTVGGRFLVRAITSIGYWIFIALALAFLISDEPALRWLSIFLIFFVFSSILHKERATKSLKLVHSGDEINVADYFSPPAWRVMENALDRHTLGGEDFHLVMLKNIFARDEMKIALLNMKVGRHEVEAKLADYSKNSSEVGIDGSSAKDEIKKIAVASFYEAIRSKSDFIKPAHIFLAMKKLKSSEYSERLLNLFHFEDGVAAGIA